MRMHYNTNVTNVSCAYFILAATERLNSDAKSRVHGAVNSIR